MTAQQNKHKIRVDYHFHPNFSLFIPFRKFFCALRAKKIWTNFTKHNLDAVIIAEHIYKNPKTTFEILEKYRPKNARTIIIPAVEVLTKEDVELIVFAENKQDIYSNETLLTPWILTVKELVALIKQNKKLFGIVAHPHTAGLTSIIRHYGEDFTKKIIKELGFVEGHNCAFTSLIQLAKISHLNKIFKNIYQQLLNTQNTPQNLLEEAKIITAGSDAHHPWEIGDCMEIEVGKNNSNNIFKILTTKSGKLIQRKARIYELLIVHLTVLKEWFTKKLHLYLVDKPLT